MSNWKFSELEYQRVDYEALKDKVVEATKCLRAAKTFEEADRVLRDMNEYNSFTSFYETLAFIRNTLNTADEFYEKEVEYLSSVRPTVLEPYMNFNHALAESKFKDDFIKKYGEMMFINIEIDDKSFHEKNVPLYQKEALLVNELQKIMASCQLSFDGKEVNLYGIKKYFEHEDREIRRKAFKAYSDFFQENEKRIDEIWGELIAIRNEMGRNMGFANYIPLGYLGQRRTDYGPKDVEAFREQVREYIVPLCVKIFEEQKKRIGLDDFYVYDEKRVFAEGNAVPAGNDDFMLEASKRMYHDLSKDTGEFFDFMTRHELFDLKNKKNKASTGYMTLLDFKKAPFVFSCFNNTIFDMQVLSHEIGHAFAGYMAMREQKLPEYYSVSTDIAEIHSMAMEQFAYDYAEDFFGADANKYRFQHLSEVLTFLPFGAAVDEFQHICYEQPELSPEERTAEWKKLEETYMPWRKYDEEDEFMKKGGFWRQKHHIFQYPFYYVNYVLASIGALEFKKKFAENQEEAWQDYLKLCKVGGSLPYLKTLEYANLSNPFLEGSVKKACSYAGDILFQEIERSAQ